MRKSSLLLVALMAVSTAFAQISTGEVNSSVIPRTGNRPQAGDFGLYLGASVTQIIDLVKLNKNKEFTENAFWALPAINLKYYFTDNWEGRLGFQFACQGSTEKVTPKGGDWTKASSDVNYTRFFRVSLTTSTPKTSLMCIWVRRFRSVLTSFKANRLRMVAVLLIKTTNSSSVPVYSSVFRCS
jgi:hypothetical protein